MRSGKLRHFVSLEIPTQVNVSGELTTSWTFVSDEPADVHTKRGNEVFKAARTQAKDTIRLQMRYRPDIDVTWRLIWNREYYYIKAVDRTKRRDGELWITAELIDAGNRIPIDTNVYIMVDDKFLAVGNALVIL